MGLISNIKSRSSRTMQPFEVGKQVVVTAEVISYALGSRLLHYSYIS